jgi:uncharacterized membrane protein YfcA
MPGTGAFVGDYGTAALLGAALGMMAGGVVKGVVGFALPLVALSIMASFLPVQVAIGLLIVPTLVANVLQSTRDGIGSAFESLKKYAWLNGVMVVVLVGAAQLVVILPQAVLFVILGIMVSGFGVVQLAGWRPGFPPRHKRLAETATGITAGFFGGISGSWGPPLVLYLLAAGVPRKEMVRVQSVTYLVGSFVLLAAHLRSGVLNAVTLPVSAWLVLPAVGGLMAGYGVQDRLDQETFRRATLVVLALAGMNLLRRGLGW